MKYLFSLNHFFWKYRFRFLLGIIFIVLTNYFRILAPQLTGYVVNSVIQKIATKAPPGTTDINKKAENIKKNDVLVRGIIHELETKSFEQKVLWCGILL